jgi:hypothetical protein
MCEGESTRPLLTRLSARLPRERLPRTRRLFELVFHSVQKFRLRLFFFAMLPPFSSFYHPRFPLALHPTFLHAPNTLQQALPPRPPPFAHPCPPALPFLCLGHDRSSKPAHRRISLRLCPKRAHPVPCSDTEANTRPRILHRPP